MKGRFLVVTSTGNKTVFVPLSRLLRIEVIPAYGQGHIPSVEIVFEGIQVTIQTKLDQETEVAHRLFEMLVVPEDIDLVYLRSEPEKGVHDILFTSLNVPGKSNA